MLEQMMALQLELQMECRMVVQLDLPSDRLMELQKEHTMEKQKGCN